MHVIWGVTMGTVLLERGREICRAARGTALNFCLLGFGSDFFRLANPDIMGSSSSLNLHLPHGQHATRVGGGGVHYEHVMQVQVYTDCSLRRQKFAVFLSRSSPPLLSTTMASLPSSIS